MKEHMKKSYCVAYKTKHNEKPLRIGFDAV